MRILTRISLLALVLTALPLAPAQAQTFDHDDVVERSFKATPGGVLTLTSDLGAVEVRGTRRDEVTVRVIKGADDVSRSRAEELFERFTLDFRETRRGVEIEGDYDGRRWGRRDGLRVVYQIEVPHAYAVDVTTSGGSVRVEDLAGDARVKTSGGSIRLAGIDGEVIARTSGGAIEADVIGGEANLQTSGGTIRLEAIEGAVVARTSGGGITMSDVHGDVEAQTSGGSIRLEEIYGTVDAQTSGGSITADLAVQPDGPVTLRTSGGSVSVALADDVRADLDARASGGRVSVDMPVTIRGAVDRGRIEGALNGGGPLITLRTSGGGIRVSRR